MKYGALDNSTLETRFDDFEPSAMVRERYFRERDRFERRYVVAE